MTRNRTRYKVAGRDEVEKMMEEAQRLDKGSWLSPVLPLSTKEHSRQS